MESARFEKIQIKGFISLTKILVMFRSVEGYKSNRLIFEINSQVTIFSESDAI